MLHIIEPVPEPQNGLSKSHINVIIASSLGTLFEWYDFSLMAAMASNIAQHFFSPLPPGKAFVMALFTFSAGVTLRPVGSLVFGHIGDKTGRKYSFLVTICMMGISTFLVGLLPTYETIGALAPILLFFLRCIQGLAVGGEYGGAATYLAEHAPHGQRGFYTGFLQATGGGGFLCCIIVVIICQTILGPVHFESWGWRIPFLLSLLILIFSIKIRINLHESPIFMQMKKEEKYTGITPLRATFGNWKNVKIILTALFGAVAGQAVLGSTHGYAMYFMTQILKIDPLTVNLMLTVSLIMSMVFCLIFANLSDKIGRKPLVMTGCFLGAVTFYPIFMGFTYYGNPDLKHAMDMSPAVVISDPNECAWQFVPSEMKEQVVFTSSCDVLKSILNNYSISYENELAPKGSIAKLKIGEYEIESVDLSGIDTKQARLAQANLSATILEAIKASGYPIKADPGKVNVKMIILLWCLLSMYSAMTYGPLAAWLVELFPTRIRYTSLSIPYHIGNGWFGGFVSTIAFAVVVYTGNIYAGLIYPSAICSIAFVIGTLFLRDTKDVDISVHE